jgi:hypothetical protein
MPIRKKRNTKKIVILTSLLGIMVVLSISIPTIILNPGNNGDNDGPPAEYIIFKMEVGGVSVARAIDGIPPNRLIVNFTNSYENPVIVPFIKTRAGPDNVEVRITNITSTNFTVFMENPGNSGGNVQEIHYIVLEKGVWTLSDGLKIEAGNIDTSSNHIGGNPYNTGEYIQFEQVFTSPPVLLYSLNTYNNGAFKGSIAHNITQDYFYLQQESAESSTSTSIETIGWIAVEAEKSGTIASVQYDTGNERDGTKDGLDDTVHTLTFNQAFSSIPLIIVKLNSANDTDGGWARGTGSISITEFPVNCEEDEVGDSEQSHNDEIFGYWAIHSAFATTMSDVLYYI